MVRQREQRAAPSAGKTARRAAGAVDKVEGDAGPVSTTRLRRGRATEPKSAVDPHRHQTVESDRLGSMLLRWACEVELASTLRDEGPAVPYADVLVRERSEDIDPHAADLDPKQSRQSCEERRRRFQDGRR